MTSPPNTPRHLDPGDVPCSPPSPSAVPLWLAETIDWSHRRGATDLHFFPMEKGAVLWVRIDGNLHEVCAYSDDIHRRAVARLKILGHCTDYDGELVQEGRFSLNGTAASGEARLSIVPTLRGDKAVVRLTGGIRREGSLDELGYCPRLLTAVRAAIDQPQGLLLAIGPSGCGKSTALFGALRDLIRRSPHPLSIVTIEDPIEQAIEGAAQINVDPARDLGFARALRAVLRQDPEVIMVGEIRDAETAEVAFQAALTGHRLLSSMHTLTPAEALVRLRQMKIPPFVLASALCGIANLRLVRLICPDCRGAAISPTRQEEIRANPGPTCRKCLNSGHLGRAPLGEWLTPTAATGEKLARNAEARDLTQTLEIKVAARPHANALRKEERISQAELDAVSGLYSLRGEEVVTP